ncbi:hypothetical protein HY502_03250 [Candidatus Woesebacteria bacterium]|nr:hypothetical protein [Candidatus Woesebacteria bacterium]
MKQIKLSGKSKLYLQALGLLALLVVLVGVVYKLAISQLPAQRVKFSEQIKKEETLRQKSEILKSLESAVLEQADLTSFAIPNKNSSFAVVSQLNKLAQENSVLITNLRIGTETKEANLSSSDLNFDVEGVSPSVLNFLQGIAGIAPITLTDKVQVNESLGVTRATVRLKAFWAEFPATLPAVSEAVSDLTPEEVEILSKIVNLTPPDFVYLEPQEPREKTDPF